MEAMMIIDTTLKIPMIFNKDNNTFEYKKYLKYAYFNYVNKGIFTYESNTLILNWDVWPQEIYTKIKYDLYIIVNKKCVDKKIKFFSKHF